MIQAALGRAVSIPSSPKYFPAVYSSVGRRSPEKHWAGRVFADKGRPLQWTRPTLVDTPAHWDRRLKDTHGTHAPPASHKRQEGPAIPRRMKKSSRPVSPQVAEL